MLDNRLFIGAGVILVIYIIHKVMKSRSRTANDYERLYSAIINSDKYKVKGQFDR